MILVKFITKEGLNVALNPYLVNMIEELPGDEDEVYCMVNNDGREVVVCGAFDEVFSRFSKINISKKVPQATKKFIKRPFHQKQPSVYVKRSGNGTRNYENNYNE